MKTLLTITAIFFSISVLGQDSTDINNTDTERPFNPFHFPKRSNDVFVAPGFQLGNQSAKLGFMYSRSKIYRHGFTAKVFSVDFGGHINQNVYTSSFGYSLASYFFIVGGRAGIKGVSYWRPEEQYAFALRPEVELIIAFIGISYGYDFFLNKDAELPVQGHNVTFSAYIPLVW